MNELLEDANGYVSGTEFAFVKGPVDLASKHDWRGNGARNDLTWLKPSTDADSIGIMVADPVLSPWYRSQH